jgi:hypothetical protein
MILHSHIIVSRSLPMNKIARLVILLLISAVVMSCVSLGGGSASLAKKDLSKVVLQPDEVPATFGNQSIFAEDEADRIFMHGDDDKVESFYGVSYLYPKDGLNLIYSAVVVFDDVESASSVYANTSGQVNSQLHLLQDAIGEESLLFKTLSGTSFYSIWRYQEAVGWVAVITKLNVGFGYDEVLDASKLMQARLEN